MKILYINPVGTIGGAEMCLLDILAQVREARPSWELKVILGDDGPLKTAIVGMGIPCEALPYPASLAGMGDAGGKEGQAGQKNKGPLAKAARLGSVGLASMSYLASLKHLIRREAPDIVQTNGMKAHVLAAWAVSRGVPLIWHLHEYLSNRPMMVKLLRASTRRSISAVAVSKSVADDARAVLGDRVKVGTIYNALDLNHFSPEGPGADDPAWLDREAGLPPAPEGTVRVGLVATYAVWKGHDVFLDAIARIPAKRPSRFYIVGGPIYRTQGSQVSLEGLKAKAESLGIVGRIGFVGHQTDPARVFRGLDVVVHASTRPEPFGRVIVEGMACGRAVIAVSDGGAAELFEDGVSALGCPPRDPAALAEAIDRLVVDPVLRRGLGVAGREATVTHFDRSRLAEQWSHLYEAVGSTA
ncbi:glycosyltransferase family 4 protein [Singulisphaera sp. PoT]|uniref:glycosyltransferase family 4 protein n=1 Tax=Singulisphaera sp. PoT TaxID=3411797 RepID=UPI003BF4F3EF